MSRSTPPATTGLLDAGNGRPIRRHPETGAYYVRKAGWPHFWGRTLDALVVMALAGILMGVVDVARQHSALGGLSTAMAVNTGVHAGVMAGIWFGVLFAYGMVWGSVGSLGDAAAGMRSVRISNGRRSGAWRGGWRAVCWSFAPLYLVLSIAAALSGSGGDSVDSSYTAIDLRSGLARGRAPVPDPAAAAHPTGAAPATPSRR
ncbi:RDD family protein [Micromonospora pallida]|uniref:RDD family protein n=1 Tax=Micromonospora pallida TaxID=145854 RepID=A0A1C6SC00_9ACTN|nr:RDD family protein [Micromonospora pallida]SCL26925.1 RDD family protein [Micromonospora pallida]